MDNAGIKNSGNSLYSYRCPIWWIGFIFLLPETIISSHVFTFFKLFLCHNLSLWPDWCASKYLTKGQTKIHNFKLIRKTQVILILAFTILFKCHYSINSQNNFLFLLMSYVYMKINTSVLYLIVISKNETLG